MTSEGGDTGLGHNSPRRFGQLPGLIVSDDFDKPLPQSEAAVWEAPGLAAQDDSDAGEELDDWPLDVADLHESLLEAEGDIAAGRTFSEEEIRARYGLPGPSAD